MPNIRCKFYDDDGKPFEESGCPRSDCPFIHPTQSNWKYAQKSRSSYRPSRGGGHERVSEWSDKGWGIGPSTGYEATRFGASDSGWSSRRASSDKPPLDQQPEASTSELKSKPSASIGWGSGGGWGSGDTSSARGTRETESNGWGNGGGGWGSGGDGGWDDAATGAWDIGGSSNTNNITTEKKSSSLQVGDPSHLPNKEPPRKDKPQTQKLPEVGGKTGGATRQAERIRSATPSVPSTVVPSSETPRKAPVPQSPVVDWAVLAAKNPITNPVLAQNTVPQRAPSHPPKTTIDAANPPHVTYNYVKALSQLIRFQVDHDNFANDYERWKKTQMSNSFSRASPATRNKLDGIRAHYANKLRSAASRLQRSINEAAELPEARPELPARRVDFTAIEQRLRGYTDELKEWEAEAKKYSELARTSAKAAAEAQALPGPTESDKPPARAVVWEQLKALVADLEGRVDAASELFYSQEYTSLMDPEERVDVIITNFRERTFQPNPSISQRVTGLGERVDQHKVGLTNQGELTTTLSEKIRANEALIEKLTAERDANKEMAVWIESQFAQFEQWQKEDEAKIERLKQQISTLHTHKEQQAIAGTKRLIMREVDSMVKRTVFDPLVEDVARVLEAYRHQCKDHQDLITGRLQDQVGPILDEMEAVYQRAQAALAAGQLQA